LIIQKSSFLGNLPGEGDGSDMAQVKNLQVEVNGLVEFGRFQMEAKGEASLGTTRE
jgi:hypothetical protein